MLLTYKKILFTLSCVCFSLYMLYVIYCHYFDGVYFIFQYTHSTLYMELATGCAGHSEVGSLRLAWPPVWPPAGDKQPATLPACHPGLIGNGYVQAQEQITISQPPSDHADGQQSESA